MITVTGGSKRPCTGLPPPPFHTAGNAMFATFPYYYSVAGAGEKRTRSLLFWETRGEIYEPLMGLKSQVEFTPPRPGQLGR